MLKKSSEKFSRRYCSKAASSTSVILTGSLSDIDSDNLGEEDWSNAENDLHPPPFIGY
jgi:hypothetical protein